MYMLRHTQGTMDVINIACLFPKLTTLLVRMDFTIAKLWFETVYLLLYLQLMFYLISIFYLKGWMLVNLLLLYYVISCCCWIKYMLLLLYYIYVHYHCLCSWYRVLLKTSLLADAVFPLNALNSFISLTEILMINVTAVQSIREMVALMYKLKVM